MHLKRAGTWTIVLRFQLDLDPFKVSLTTLKTAGMVDSGENVSTTVRREFMEEALNGLEMENDSKQNVEKMLNDFFSKGTKIYQG